MDIYFKICMTMLILSIIPLLNAILAPRSRWDKKANRGLGGWVLDITFIMWLLYGILRVWM